MQVSRALFEFFIHLLNDERVGGVLMRPARQSVTYSWSYLDRVVRVAGWREDHLKSVWCELQMSRHVLIRVQALLRQSKVLLHTLRVGVGLAVLLLL